MPPTPPSNEAESERLRDIAVMRRVQGGDLEALRELIITHQNRVAAAIARSRKKFPKLKVEVEADTLAQVAQAADAGADIILLDNMSPAQMREAVAITAGRAQLEASGGITLANVREIAMTGVNRISVGALTKDIEAVDLSMRF